MNWCTPLAPEFRRQKQADLKISTSCLDKCIVGRVGCWFWLVINKSQIRRKDLYWGFSSLLFSLAQGWSQMILLTSAKHVIAGLSCYIYLLSHDDSCRQSSLCQSDLACLVGFLLLRWKHHHQKPSWGGKSICLVFLDHNSSLKEARTGTEAGLDPGGRAAAEAMEKCCSSLLPLACSACLLLEPRATWLGMEALTVGWAFPWSVTN